MPTYESTLPNIFPYVAELEPEDIRKVVTIIMASDRTDVPMGSSFAVTVDGHKDGDWRLWMSNATYQFLCTEYFKTLFDN